MILGRYPSNTLYHEKKTNGLYEKHNAHLHRHYTFHKACQLFTLCKVSSGYTRKNCIVFFKKNYMAQHPSVHQSEPAPTNH
jgi:hypothetical protein